MDADDATAPWYLTARFRRCAWIALGIFIAVEGWYAVFVRRNDFICHVMFGENFLARDPYQRIGNYYPLGRLMADTLLTFANYYLTRAVCYLIAVAGLLHSFRIWRRISLGNRPVDGRVQFAAVALAFGILVPFIIRDFDECGLQILLLWMLSLAADAFARRRKALSGFWLAAAITWKATPLLFFPFLLWKRQWKTAAWTVVFVAGLNLLPATYLGWHKTVDAHKYWFAHNSAILQNTAQAHPEIPEIEAPKHENLSLRALIARCIETYPDGHPLKLDHPLFVQFGRLDVRNAKRAVTACVLLLGLVIAWKLRRGWNELEPGSRFAREWSVACVYSALLSPLCWKQHLVLLVPLVLLIAQAALLDVSNRRLKLLVAGLLVGMWLPSRFLLGRELAVVMMSYNLPTLAAVVSSLAILWLPEPADSPAVHLPIDLDGNPPGRHIPRAA